MRGGTRTGAVSETAAQPRRHGPKPLRAIEVENLRMIVALLRRENAKLQAQLLKLQGLEDLPFGATEEE